MTDGSGQNIVVRLSLGPSTLGENNNNQLYLLKGKFDTSICPFCKDFVVSAKHSYLYKPSCSIRRNNMNSEINDLISKNKEIRVHRRLGWTDKNPLSDQELKKRIAEIEDSYYRDPQKGALRADTYLENGKYFEEFFGTGTTIDIETKQPTIIAKNMFSNPLRKSRKGTVIAGLGNDTVLSNFVTNRKTGCNSWFSRVRIPDIYSKKDGFLVSSYNVFDRKGLGEMIDKNLLKEDDERKIKKNKLIKIKNIY